MQIVTNGRNIELTEAIKDYVQQKVSRLENHYDFLQEVHVILEVEKNPRISQNQLAEATVHVPGAIVRVETASESLYASIDMLVDKIERSLRKHKTKLMNRNSKHTNETIRKDMGLTPGSEEAEELTLEEVEEDIHIEVAAETE